MYRVLKSTRKTLITADEVVAVTATDNNVDPRQIDAAIQIAEDRFIRNSICQNFYKDFVNRKNVVVTLVNELYLEGLVGANLEVGQVVNAIELVSDQDYVDFWHEHLWKWIAECVVYVASPTNYSRFTSSGEMENNPNAASFEGQNSASVPLANMKWKMDKMMQDRIDPLRAAAELYLFNNIGLFPYVDCKNWDVVTTPTGVSKLRKSGWIFGIYDDQKGGRCKPCDDLVTRR